MTGKLYLVGTPIGNLGDLSPRAVQTLQDADFIAAEDTRVTAKLLHHFAIQTPVLSYHQHNSKARGQEILDRIANGENCAIVTDAGMPCISDPGEDLVSLCAQHGIEVVAVPGPSAVITALAISGLSTARFSFEGFLSTNQKNRKAHLEQIQSLRHTLIFYEAPHKLLRTLQDLLAAFGNRRISLCREMTKLHEQVVRTNLENAVQFYSENTPKGEFVLIVEGAPPPQTDEVSLADAAQMVRSLSAGGIPLSEAAKTIAQKTGLQKNVLYKEALKK